MVCNASSGWVLVHSVLVGPQWYHKASFPHLLSIPTMHPQTKGASTCRRQVHYFSMQHLRVGRAAALVFSENIRPGAGTLCEISEPEQSDTTVAAPSARDKSAGF